MNGPSHRQLGVLAGMTAAALSGQHDTRVTLLSGAVASASAHGWLSPDVDQHPVWVRVRQTVRPFLPRGYDRVLNHRYLSHWWGLPVAGYGVASAMPPEFSWAALMLVVGWASHLVGDFVFGEDPNGGIPLTPWGGHVGLKLDTGGFWETGRARVWGRSRALVPFGPVRVVIGAGIVWALVAGLG